MTVGLQWRIPRDPSPLAVRIGWKETQHHRTAWMCSCFFALPLSASPVTPVAGGLLVASPQQRPSLWAAFAQAGCKVQFGRNRPA